MPKKLIVFRPRYESTISSKKHDADRRSEKSDFFSAVKVDLCRTNKHVCTTNREKVGDPEKSARKNKRDGDDDKNISLSCLANVNNETTKNNQQQTLL